MNTRKFRPSPKPRVQSSSLCAPASRQCRHPNPNAVMRSGFVYPTRMGSGGTCYEKSTEFLRDVKFSAVLCVHVVHDKMRVEVIPVAVSGNNNFKAAELFTLRRKLQSDFMRCCGINFFTIRK